MTKLSEAIAASKERLARKKICIKRNKNLIVYGKKKRVPFRITPRGKKTELGISAKKIVIHKRKKSTSKI